MSLVHIFQDFGVKNVVTENNPKSIHWKCFGQLLSLLACHWIPLVPFVERRSGKHMEVRWLDILTNLRETDKNDQQFAF